MRTPRLVRSCWLGRGGVDGHATERGADPSGVWLVNEGARNAPDAKVPHPRAPIAGIKPGLRPNPRLRISYGNAGPRHRGLTAESLAVLTGRPAGTVSARTATAERVRRGKEPSAPHPQTTEAPCLTRNTPAPGARSSGRGTLCPAWSQAGGWNAQQAPTGKAHLRLMRHTHQALVAHGRDRDMIRFLDNILGLVPPVVLGAIAYENGFSVSASLGVVIVALYLATITKRLGG